MAEAEKMETYTAALIIIGNEILSGRTQDTNTAWIAERLVDRGTVIKEVRIIPDSEDSIIDAVLNLKSKVDYVFSTGGIGPTHDDITAGCIAKAFGVNLEVNKEACDMLCEHYGEDNVTEARMKMAMIPEGSVLIPNHVSGAPGFAIENVFVMAGVPRIMQAMFINVLTMIKIGRPLISNTVSCSLQESVLADDLSSLQNKYFSVEVGSYPHYRGGIHSLSIVLRSSDDDMLNAATKELLRIIEDHGGEPGAISIKSSDKDPEANLS